MKISAKMIIFKTFQQNFANPCKIAKNLRKSEKFDFGAVQRFANLVDLEKCCKMSIYLQKSASIQLKSSPDKFAVKVGLIVSISKNAAK